MRIITANLNGIRSAGRKEFFPWMLSTQADVICVQETKAQMSELSDELYYPEPYHSYFADAEKKGYSGVGIYCKQQPKKVITEFGWEPCDSEGRFLQCDFDGFSVVSIYLPSGSSGEARQAVKYEFLDVFATYFNECRRKRREFIFCGDFNIVHTEKDIKNWKSNQKNSGCLPEERAWLDHIFDDIGLVDAFRVVNQQDEQYTWWSNRGQAYAKNVGWRIDYQVVTPGLTDKIQREEIYKQQKFSDHAPLIIDYDL